MEFRLVWFDSFGAKSSCVAVKAGRHKLVIDPGIAIMHPSFPASAAKKAYWYAKGRKAVINALKWADLVVISHYHWDHFIPEPRSYIGKKLFVKNPNEYINDSQRKRAEEFFGKLFELVGIKKTAKKKRRKSYEDPCKRLRSVKLDFGDYQRRRKELLRLGRKWFKTRVERWGHYEPIPEVANKSIKLVFPEGKTFRFGPLKLRFTKPLFHGIEYSRVGWVFATIVEWKGKKLLPSSDLNGPIIEDYADWIIEENPTHLILDGPMTYMLGYTMNRTNFRRVLANAKRIVEEDDFEVMIWDHHLPRESRFRTRTKEVWELAKRLGKNLLTASEYQLRKKPVVESS